MAKRRHSKDTKQTDPVLVKAPTSARKNICGNEYRCNFHQKVLVCGVCQTSRLSSRGCICENGLVVCSYLLEESLRTHDKQTNIFVGVPDTIEECLPKIGASYDYAVFDEFIP